MTHKAYPAHAYTPFGHRRSHDSLLAVNGEPHDALCGLYPLGNGHRMYNPTLMRFYSPDTLSPFAQGGIHCYAYCGNDPVNWHDPTGKNAQFRLLNKGIKILGAGVATAALKKNQDFIVEAALVSKYALVPGDIASSNFPVERIYLDQHLNPTARMFNRAVQMVNRNLASNGNADLSLQQAIQYAQATHSSNSNSTLFFTSTAGWLRKLYHTGQPGALSGAAFNFFGGLVNSQQDHHPYRTGNILRQASVSSERIRTRPPGG